MEEMKLFRIFNELMFDERQLESLPTYRRISRKTAIFIALLLGYFGIDMIYLKSGKWWMSLVFGIVIPLVVAFFGDIFMIFAYISIVINYIWQVYRITFYVSLNDIRFEDIYDPMYTYGNNNCNCINCKSDCKSNK